MELKGKKVLVVGLGKSGLAAALFLRRRGAQVTVSDLRSAQALSKEVPSLLEAGISVEAGGHGLLTFRRQDLIVVSPGVPLSTPELVQVRTLGLPIIGELELAARFLQGDVLAITGSNGKTTTTTLCGEIFSASGRKTLVAGNIGLPVIEVVDKSGTDTWSVLEVSSFQLETTESFHPHIAAILNITPDHLDRHGTFENYVAMKEKIFANQTGEDYLILNGDDPVTQQAASRARSQVFWFSRTKIVRRGTFVHNGAVMYRASEQSTPVPVLPIAEIPLKGEHNVENVLAAVCAASVAGIAPDVIERTVKAFHAVEHRLEFVASIHGVVYYNDSKATNVDATAKAIAAFPANIHLILGGKDKNSDYSQLNSLLKERVKTVYTIGSAAEKIEGQITGVTKVIRAGTLEAAVDQASNHAVAGDVVLLAPACSSFDQFENYEQRGRVFKQAVLSRQGAGVWQNA
ncbi:MAG TPA: UDP-N-acetylmuramoyl-L-alanine--D-glutamate ligase [Acidobacteriaceae bacterium]|nr:UDP-N-acetylmuramoyl-L-alanine--D-glutamate ligase [Acidobacteriaceae bacterium]